MNGVVTGSSPCLAQTLMINYRRAATDLGWRNRHTAAETLAAT